MRKYISSMHQVGAKTQPDTKKSGAKRPPLFSQTINRFQLLHFFMKTHSHFPVLRQHRKGNEYLKNSQSEEQRKLLISFYFFFVVFFFKYSM